MKNFIVDFNDTPFVKTSYVAPQVDRLNWRAELLLTQNQEAIKNKRILDLASHDGRFSWACLKLGAKYITGIEGRPHLVESSIKNLNILGFDSTYFNFICSDIFAHLDKFEPGQFDTILCFGFFYHTLRQPELLAQVKRLKPSTFILDTRVKRIPNILKLARWLLKIGLFSLKSSPEIDSPLAELLAGQYFVYRKQDITKDGNTIDPLALAAIPTDKAVKLLLKTYGFSFRKINWEMAEVENYTNQQPSPIENNYGFFDIGVVDINKDGALDIFTANHYARSNLLLGNSQGKFTDILSQYKLDQDRQFPSLEDSENEPPINHSGIYIYWYLGELNIVTHHTKEMGSVSGKIEVFTQVKAERNNLVDIDLQEKLLSSGATQSNIKFTLQENGRLILKPYQVALPFSFKLDENVPLNHIYIGAKKVQPKSHNFVLALRDRHGIAWADYNADRKIDVFMSRGGMKGEMKKIPQKFSDELLANRGSGSFEDITFSSGIIKDDCPAKQVAWVDYNNDNRLDLYILCSRSNLPFRNQLYRQETNGKFINVAKELGLDFSGEGIFAWLDVDGDRDMDLVWASKELLQLYVNQAGRFAPHNISPIPGGKKLNGETGNLAISDFDLDGDLDMILTSYSGSIAFLTNNHGTYKLIEPTSIGLPIKGLTANWVDYDNDGLPDLHIIPYGLFRQRPDHSFEATQLLEFSSSKKSQVVDARCTWFDADNDGFRDALIAMRILPSSKLERKKDSNSKKNYWLRNWHSAIYHNISSGNHWLQIELIGSLGNLQAIGASVMVITPSGKQLQQVGSTDGFRISQGHYRLYFGLGKHNRPDLVKIFWPDGKVQEIHNPPGDQLLVIEREAEQVA